MTPPRVSNTHMPTHTLQQQNTPTRGHPTSHLSRHSTPLQQRGTIPSAPIISTILKTTQPSCINTQTNRHNLQWRSQIDTEFTMVTSCQNAATNDARYMNLSSNQLTAPTMVTGHHNPILAHTNGTENRREPPMCFRCEKQGHKQQRCWEQNVYCTKCQYNNHNTEACRRYPDPTTQTPHRRQESHSMMICTTQ